MVFGNGDLVGPDFAGFGGARCGVSQLLHGASRSAANRQPSAATTIDRAVRITTNLVTPGSASGVDVEAAVPLQVLGNELLLRIQRLIPGDLLAGVGGHAAHDREQRAGGHALAVVHRLVLADGGEQQVVLASGTCCTAGR